MKNNELILGSRGSRLALYQVEQVASLLRARWPRLSVRIEVVQTQGDRDRQAPLASFSGVGVFVKELEQALLDDRIDAAVHSLKDMPTQLPGDLRIAAVPIREEWRDALISASGRPLAELGRGATIGTGSPRRAAQLRVLRPDVQPQPIRGNVETRIRKMREQDMAGIVLSYAGLLRLGLADQASEVFPASAMLPAPGQGAIAVECRAADDETLKALAGIHDEQAGQAVEAERDLLARLGGGCHVPIGALALPQGDGSLRLQAIVCSADGAQVIRAEATGDARDPAAIAAVIADQLLSEGAKELLGTDCD